MFCESPPLGRLPEAPRPPSGPAAHPGQGRMKRRELAEILTRPGSGKQSMPYDRPVGHAPLAGVLLTACARAAPATPSSLLPTTTPCNRRGRTATAPPASPAPPVRGCLAAATPPPPAIPPRRPRGGWSAG